MVMGDRKALLGLKPGKGLIEAARTGLRRSLAGLNAALEFLERICIIVLEPWRRLLAAIRRQEEAAAAKIEPGWSRSLRLWLAQKFLQLVFWGVYWAVAAPVYVIQVFFVFLLMFFFIIKPFTYTQWVGAAWVAAIVIWALMAALRRWWSKGLAEIALFTAIGLTPQVVFLLTYNGFSDAEITPPWMIQPAINAYEFAAVWLNAALRPITEIGWGWWAAGATIVLGVSLLLNRPGLLSRALIARKAVATAIFLTSVTAAVCLSTAQPVGSWEPDIQHRLQASLERRTLAETKIALSLALVRWIQQHPGIETKLPAYLQNLNNAWDQIEHDSGKSQAARNDLVIGLRQTVDALVPGRFGDVLVSNIPASTASYDVGGRVSDLLKRDAEMKRSNRDIEEKADQVRRTSSALIAQIVDVPVEWVPLLSSIVEEIINAAAESLSERIAERMPVEQAITETTKVSDFVGDAINGDIEAIFKGVFRGSAGSLHARIDGARPEEVNKFMKESTAKATQARIETEREARVEREAVRVP
jgi:hypothetical protein